MVWQETKPYHNLYLYHPFPQLLYIASLSNLFNDFEDYLPRPIQLELILSIVHFVLLDTNDPHHQHDSIVQESSILMGVVQSSTLVFETPIF